MTTRQKIELRLSKVRQRLNAIAALEGDAFTPEIREEAETLQTEYRDLEIRHRAAIVGDGDGGEPGDGAGEDGEARELRELEGRVEVRRYIGAAMEGGAVDGAEAEFNAALEMGAGAFPLRLLAPEARTTTDTEAGANQGTWLDRLFASSAAARLGVSFRSVGPGVAAYPVTTAGASAAQRGRGRGRRRCRLDRGRHGDQTQPERRPGRLLHRGRCAAPGAGGRPPA